jgi:hypothetical protein
MPGQLAVKTEGMIQVEVEGLHDRFRQIMERLAAVQFDVPVQFAIQRGAENVRRRGVHGKSPSSRRDMHQNRFRTRLQGLIDRLCRLRATNGLILRSELAP